MFNIKRLGLDTIVYGVGVFLQRGATLFLVPIYTSVLLVSEFGVLETLIVTQHTLRLFLNFGLSSSLLRYYSECSDDNDAKVMVRTSSSLVLILSLGMFLPLRLFLDKLGILLFDSINYGSLIFFAFLWAVGGALNDQLLSYYRAKQDSRSYALLSVILSLVLIVFNIYFVRVMRLGVMGVLLGNLIAIFSIDAILLTKFWFPKQSISWFWASKLIRFGFPLIFAMFGWLILNSADRYFIAYYRDLREVGIYGLGYKIGLIVHLMVVAPFQLAWGPFVFERYNKLRSEASQHFSRIFTYLLFVLSAVSLGMFLFSQELVFFFGGKEYGESIQVIPFILVAYFFSGIYYWGASLFHLTKKTSLISVIVFVTAGLNLFLNWLWIPVMGWRGAAISTAVSIGITGILTLLIGLSLYAVPLQLVRIAKLFIVTALVVSLAISIPVPVGPLGWLSKAAILLGFPLGLALLGFYESREIKLILDIPQLFIRKFQLAITKSI